MRTSSAGSNSVTSAKRIDPLETVRYIRNNICGFEWGKCQVTRMCSDEKRGWVMLEVVGKGPTGGRKSVAHIEISKTGKMRISVTNAKVYVTPSSKVMEYKHDLA